MFEVFFEFAGEASTLPPISGTFKTREAAHLALVAAGYRPFDGEPGPDEDGDDQWENDRELDQSYQFADVVAARGGE